METGAAVRIEDRELTPAEIELLATLVVDEADHYTVLGVARGASASEINDAYCRAVQFFHPLKYSHLLESNKILHWKLSSAYTRIVEAFSTLSSRVRREAYDGTINRQIVGWVRSRERGMSATGSRQVGSLAQPPASTSEPYVPLNGRERRRVERAQLRLPLVVVFDHRWQETTETIDVSPLGVKFSLSRAVEPGTLVRLELPMPADLRTTSDDNVLYAVSGYVIHVNPEAGKSIVVAEFV
jgi:hypothetical protein